MRLWCMRFEPKHDYFRRLGQGMTNFKNLPKTLAVRHQCLQCYWLCEEDVYLKPVPETGPGEKYFMFCVCLCIIYNIIFYI